MRAIVISIGDELTSGQTLNTNASWLSQQLTSLGIPTAAHLTVPDELLPIVRIIRESIETDVDLLLISGGLGPTEDDLTRQALADALGEELVEDPTAVVQIENWFNSRNRTMSASNRLQALRPTSAEVLENRTGTAPGLMAHRNKTSIFVMPGVPSEMRNMFATSILPRLQKSAPNRITRITKLNTFGRGESLIGEAIKDLMARANTSDSLRVGTTANDGIVAVRIYATGTPDEVQAITDRVTADVRQRLGPIIFSENDAPLEEAVAKLLTSERYTLATAESCTGGLLAKLLTDTPGSSAYFQRGWITYANDAKHAELAIPGDLLEQHGAVSEQVARAMAEGARRFAQTDFALATTGIAGPDGGSPEKPVGTVWIALAHDQGTDVRRFHFHGSRHAIRLRTAQTALALLRYRLLNLEPLL